MIEGTTYFGLEVTESNGVEYFSLLKIVRKNGELESVLETVVPNLDDVLNHLEKKAPVFLTLNTKEVLKKQITGANETANDFVILNAFPNLELDNFYYDVVQTGKEAMVGISKKEYVDAYVNSLKTAGIEIYSVALGLVPLGNLSSLLEGPIQGSDYEITFKDGALSHYRASSFDLFQKQYDVNGLKVGKNHLLSLSHLIGHFIGSKALSNLGEVNMLQAFEYKNSRLFEFGLKSSLVFFLIILLVNFFLFSHYNNKNEILTNDLTHHKVNNNSLQELKKRVVEKENRLLLLAGSKNSKSSYFFDEIGKFLPYSILLETMVYQPLNTPVRENKPIETKKNSLLISGTTSNKLVFTDWYESLETKEWVSSAEIVEYKYISSSSADFTLKLELNEAY
ncbi:MAG: hypothetical protein AB3N14_03230 [Flavobacteriaceae bacterium]